MTWLKHTTERSLIYFYSGYNTNHALEVLPQFFPTPSQATVRFLVRFSSFSSLSPIPSYQPHHKRLTPNQFLFFGANDLNLGPSTNQHVPLDTFTSNLQTIISHPLIQAHKPKIILVTPAPVDEATCRDTNKEWGNNDEPRRVKDTKRYRDAVMKIGEEGGYGVADIWSKFMSACGLVVDFLS